MNAKIVPLGFAPAGTTTRLLAEVKAAVAVLERSIDTAGEQRAASLLLDARLALARHDLETGSEFPEGCTLVFDPSAPMPFATWLDGDLIGAGHSPEYAVNDARSTIRRWS